jgi:hypothetical protein
MPPSQPLVPTVDRANSRKAEVELDIGIEQGDERLYVACVVCLDRPRKRSTFSRDIRHPVSALEGDLAGPLPGLAPEGWPARRVGDCPG